MADTDNKFSGVQFDQVEGFHYVTFEEFCGDYLVEFGDLSYDNGRKNVQNFGINDALLQDYGPYVLAFSLSRKDDEKYAIFKKLGEGLDVVVREKPEFDKWGICFVYGDLRAFIDRLASHFKPEAPKAGDFFALNKMKKELDRLLPRPNMQEARGRLEASAILKEGQTYG